MKAQPNPKFTDITTELKKAYDGASNTFIDAIKAEGDVDDAKAAFKKAMQDAINEQFQAFVSKMSINGVEGKTVTELLEKAGCKDIYAFAEKYADHSAVSALYARVATSQKIADADFKNNVDALCAASKLINGVQSKIEESVEYAATSIVSGIAKEKEYNNRSVLNGWNILIGSATAIFASFSLALLYWATISQDTPVKIIAGAYSSLFGAGASMIGYLMYDKYSSQKASCLFSSESEFGNLNYPLFNTLTFSHVSSKYVFTAALPTLETQIPALISNLPEVVMPIISKKVEALQEQSKAIQGFFQK